MVIKFISLVIALCAVELFVIGLQSPSDSLFLVISNNPFAVSIRILLILAAITIAFKNRFIYKLSRQLIGWLGFLLMTFGFSGMMSQTITDEFSAFLKYLDFWLIFLIGVVFSLSVLTYQAGHRRFRLQKVLARRLPKAWAARLSPNLAKQAKQKSAF